MEHLPVEVIGNILSLLGAAQDVVIASSACRKWREAWRNHLHTLTFNSNDWPVYHEMTRSRLEILITQTIFQTTGLQQLLIIMDDVDEFSAAPVIAWSMYTRETLRQLYYNQMATTSISHDSEKDEEEFVILDLNDVSKQVDIQPNAPYVLSGLDTLNPTLVINNKLKLVGEYEETIGTCIVFSESDATPVVHEETGPSDANLFSGVSIIDPKQASSKQILPIAQSHKILKFRLAEEVDIKVSTIGANITANQ